MRMQKRQFRIGELAKKLAVEKFVIRFWEKEFNLSTHRSTGGQRFYNEDDYSKFKTIKTLLYEKKFTIAGAKKELAHGATILGSHRTTMSSAPTTKKVKELKIELTQLKKQLKELQKLI